MSRIPPRALLRSGPDPGPTLGSNPPGSHRTQRIETDVLTDTLSFSLTSKGGTWGYRDGSLLSVRTGCRPGRADGGPRERREVRPRPPPLQCPASCFRTDVFSEGTPSFDEGRCFQRGFLEGLNDDRLSVCCVTGTVDPSLRFTFLWCPVWRSTTPSPETERTGIYTTFDLAVESSPVSSYFSSLPRTVSCRRLTVVYSLLRSYVLLHIRRRKPYASLLRSDPSRFPRPE